MPYRNHVHTCDVPVPAQEQVVRNAEKSLAPFCVTFVTFQKSDL